MQQGTESEWVAAGTSWLAGASCLMSTQVTLAVTQVCPGGKRGPVRVDCGEKDANAEELFQPKRGSLPAFPFYLNLWYYPFISVTCVWFWPLFKGGTWHLRPFLVVR